MQKSCILCLHLCTFSFRFDPEVIEERKKKILEFLYFCVENPVLYRSQCFVKFFEGGEVSPSEEAKEFDQNCDDGSSNSDEIESRNNSIELDDEAESSVTEDPPVGLDKFENFHLVGSDYLYEAAICFSRAVQEEANLRYKSSFELYKVGIDKLLTGAKNDSNENRKRIAKTKAEKYLERAESLYENQIAQSLESGSILCDETIVSPLCEHLPALELPSCRLSDFKLVSIQNRVMRVKDKTTNKFYVLKTHRRDVNSKHNMPKNIPYMVKLINFYKSSDETIFLLLPMISGGLLWDYINSYSRRKSMTRQTRLEEIFVDPPSVINENIEENLISVEMIMPEDEPNAANANINSSNEDDNVDDRDVVDSFKNFTDDQVRSFDTLSSEMDINDLLSCSMNLLQSVSKTLEKSRVEKDAEEVINVKDEIDNENSPIINCEPVEIEESQPDMSDSYQQEDEFVQKLPESVLKQWTCELIVAVNSLHSANIICGDLNLDNLLLGPEGHLMLTYFFQKTRDEFQQLCRLNPAAVKCLYVAFDFPITKSSDWYSVGVIIYEIYTRERFYRNHPGGIFRFNEIQYTNPDELSEDLKDLLHQLIIEKSEKRMKFEDLICHPFFADVDWSSIETSGIDLHNKY